MSDPYVESLRRMRREKDDWFKLSPHSPLPSEERGAFAGLRYFEPDATFRVEAAWEPAVAPPVVRMQTSTGEEREYLAAGKFRFQLGGSEHTLDGFAALHAHAHDLFVPLRDMTSGKDTYGAGRYLDVPLPHHGAAQVDFNLAYNPYCAYNEEYSCPFPPPANWLKAEVRAGEKTYQQ